MKFTVENIKESIKKFGQFLDQDASRNLALGYISGLHDAGVIDRVKFDILFDWVWKEEFPIDFDKIMGFVSRG